MDSSESPISKKVVVNTYTLEVKDLSPDLQSSPQLNYEARRRFFYSRIHFRVQGMAVHFTVGRQR